MVGLGGMVVWDLYDTAVVLPELSGMGQPLCAGCVNRKQGGFKG